VTDNPQVSICVPTWQSEGFIDKTLTYARNQTWFNVRILVSIDQSDDRTSEICQRHASEDARVRVFVQEKRLGWARNINFLLDRVCSEYFFIYFHDDIIDSRYVEKLLTRMLECPDAGCAYCDVLYVTASGQQTLSRGREIYGDRAERFLHFALGTGTGEPLRALTRTSVTGPALRFVEASELGLFAQWPFDLQKFTAGPVLHVPEVLYWRLHLRKGGLTRRWRTVSNADLLKDLRAIAERCLELIDGMDASTSDALMMRFSLYTLFLRNTHDLQMKLGAESLIDPSAIAPALQFSGVPSAVKDASPEIRNWAISRYAWLVSTDGWYYLKKKDFRRALASFTALKISHALLAVRVLGKVYTRMLLPRLFRAPIPADLRDRLVL